VLLNVVGFLLALLFAIPTFGLSLVAFFVIKYIVDVQSVSKLALTALSAHTGDPIATTDVSNAAIRMFYKKYGTTEKKCEDFMSPALSFIGYVNVGRSETVAIIQKPRGGIIVSCIEPPMQFGNDFASLIGKGAFIKDLMQDFGASA
jgi:hypothetical protein